MDKKKIRECAEMYLTKQGYAVVTRMSDEDIAAISNEGITFFHINNGMGSFEDGIPPREKWEKIAIDYLKDSDYSEFPVLFDVVSVLPLGNNKAMIRHFHDALGGK